MLCDHSGNYGRLERGRTEQGSEKMTIAKRLYTGVMPDKTASRLIKRIKKRKPWADVLIRDIIRDVYGTTGKFDCKDYFLYDMTVC